MTHSERVSIYRCWTVTFLVTLIIGFCCALCDEWQGPQDAGEAP